MRLGRRACWAGPIGLAAVLAALVVAPAAGAATCAYTGPSGGSWDDPANWGCNARPGAADDVQLGGGDSVLIAAADEAAASLAIASGATLAFASARKLDVAGVTSAATGTLTGAGRLNAGGGVVKSAAGQLTLTGGVTVTSQADSTWSGGDVCLLTGSTLRLQTALDVAAGAGTLNCSSSDSSVQVTATSLIRIAGGTRTWFSQVDVDGAVQIDAGGLTLAAPSPNTDAGAWLIAAPAQLTVSASRTLGASATLGGAGSLTVNSGTVTVPGGATLGPATLTLAGGEVDLNGTSPATGLPLVNLEGGTFGGTRNRLVTTLAARAGTITGAQTTTVTGSLVKSTAGQLLLTGGVTLHPAVDSAWSAGDVCLQTGSTLLLDHLLDVAAGAGGFNCSSSDSLVRLTPTGSIDVAGGTRTWFSQLDTDGLVHVDGGSLTLSAPSPNTDSGSWSIAQPAQLTISGSRSLGGSATLGGAGALVVNSGTVTVPDGARLSPAVLTAAGGTLTLDGTAPATTLPQVSLQGGTLGGTRARTITTLAAQSGTLTGAQTTTVNGSLVKSTAGQLLLTGGVTLRPDVDAAWSAGDICLQTGSTLRLEHRLDVAAGAGAFNCSSSDSLVQVTPTGSVDVAGGTRSWFSSVDLDGSLQLAAGNLTLAAASANSDGGSLAIAAPAQLTLVSSRTLASGAGLGGPGTLAVASGTLTVPDGASLSPTSLALTGGTVNIDGAAPATTLPQVDLQGGTLGGTRNRAIGALAAQGGTLTGAQTTTVTGSLDKSTAGQLSLTGRATLQPVVDTTWSAGDICLQTEARLELAHRLDVRAGAGTFNCSSADARVDVLGGGEVSLAGPGRTWFSHVRNAGLLGIGAGESLTFNGGLENLAGGTLTGAGTAGGAITNAGGLVSPLGGVLRLTGVLSQSAGRTDVGAGETLDNTSPITLTGGTLGGSGTIAHAVANSGATVQPGSSPGRLTIGGDYTQGAGATLEAELAGTEPGVGFDQLAIGGAAALGGTLAIVRSPDFVPPVGTKLQLITSATRSGGFATLTGAGFGDRSFADDGSTPGFALVVGGPATPTPTPSATPTPSPSPSPTPTPAPTPRPPLARASPGRVATAFGLRRAKHCIPRGDFTARLHAPQGITVERVRMTVNGARVRVRKVRGRWRATIDLRRVHGRAFTLAFRVRTADGRTLNGRRAYRICAPRKPRRQAMQPPAAGGGSSLK